MHTATAMATVVYTAEPIDSIPWFQLWVPGAIITNPSFRSTAASSDFAVSARSGGVSVVEEDGEVVCVVDDCGGDGSNKNNDTGEKNREEEEGNCCLHCCCGIV